MGKAKPTKHSAGEIRAKIAASTTNKGGGKAGLKDRTGGAAGHAKYKCHVCAQQAPDLKSMEAHWDSKHTKMGPFEAEKCTNMHAVVGKTTVGIGIRGSTKKEKEKAKKEKKKKK